MLRNHSDDSGTAAVELVFCLLAIFGVIALAAPLATLLLTQTRLERAAGVAARFATQIPDRSRPGSAGYKPTDTEVITAATTAAQNAGLGTATDWTTPVISRTNGTAPASVVSVKLQKTVQMTGFGSILSFIGVLPSSVTVTATATGRQE
jgi:hypothetical protein